LIDDGTWNGWEQIASEDKTGNFNYVNPGYGGQDFDAEYLFYKASGSTLFLGLQTGFDVVDGHVEYGNKNYWAGDLVLSMAGTDYAVDFGLSHCGWSDRDGCATPQVDTAGLYENIVWDNDVAYGSSGPLAMASGDLIVGLDSNIAGSADVNGETSYFRQVAFDVSSLGLGDEFDLDIHWTMSCGNDLIEAGTVVQVSEPGTIVMLVLGVAGLALLRRRSN
jgi:hypothetical protein